MVQVLQENQDEDGSPMAQTLVNSSDQFNGLTPEKASEEIIKELQKLSMDNRFLSEYRIRDWLVSR